MMSVQMRSYALERPGVLVAAHSAQLRNSVAATPPLLRHRSPRAHRVRHASLPFFTVGSSATSLWVSMPLGAADAAARCASSGIAAKKGG
jgi:hypothetical protein